MFVIEFDDTDGSVVLEVKRPYLSWLEKLAHNEKVIGSIPVGRTNGRMLKFGIQCGLKIRWTLRPCGFEPHSDYFITL